MSLYSGLEITIDDTNQVLLVISYIILIFTLIQICAYGYFKEFLTSWSISLFISTTILVIWNDSNIYPINEQIYAFFAVIGISLMIVRFMVSFEDWLLTITVGGLCGVSFIYGKDSIISWATNTLGASASTATAIYISIIVLAVLVLYLITYVLFQAGATKTIFNVLAVTIITTLAMFVLRDEGLGFGKTTVELFNITIYEIVFFFLFGIAYSISTYQIEVEKEERQYQRMHARRQQKQKQVQSPTKDVSGFKLIERIHELKDQPQTAV